MLLHLSKIKTPLLTVSDTKFKFNQFRLYLFFNIIANFLRLLSQNNSWAGFKLPPTPHRKNPPNHLHVSLLESMFELSTDLK
jgi:hypothetical protein